MRGSLTPEQQRNRARALVALRVLAAMIAVGTASTLWRGISDGYYKLGVGDVRGGTGDYTLLDTTLGRAIGSFMLESIFIFFGLLAIKPKYALSPRVLVPSAAAALIASIVLGVFYQ